MKAIYTAADFNSSQKISFHKEKWTAVVPMAGKGSRLNYDKPKALYPILGKSILYWMWKALEKNCAEILLVVSPEGERALQEEIKALNISALVKTIQQKSPKGMADAVLCSKNAVKTENVVVVWGDQVTLSAKTLSQCQGLLETSRASLSLPTYWMQDPYIALDRDVSDRIVRVRQRREGEIQEQAGENDCGLFCFNTAALFAVLESKQSLGKNTKEFNLLPLLPFFDDNGKTTVTLRVESAEETLGVNTVEDAKKAEEVLSKR